MKDRFITIGIFFLIVCYSHAQLVNLRNWNKTEKDSLEKALQLLEENKTTQALPIFEAILNHHPTEDFLKYSFAKCALPVPERHTEAAAKLNEVYLKNKKAPDIHYYLALSAYYNSGFDEALNYITAYLNNRKIPPKARTQAEELKRKINIARYYYTHPNRARIFNLGTTINAEKNEWSVALDANAEKLIYLLAEGAQQPTFTNKIMQCTKPDGELSAALPLKVDKMAAMAAVWLSNDASKLLVCMKNEGSESDIYLSVLNVSGYSSPIRLKGEINSFYEEMGACLSPNGKTMYFSSNRPGGKGGFDLYKADLSEDSTWINCINLGDSVNTEMDEVSPFLHANGKTLFFSSAGHNSMGGQDIFVSTIKRDSSFRKPENLGYPINSPYNETGFVVSANSETAYFSSNRKEGRGGSDVYFAEPRIKGFKPSLCLLKGKLLKNELPVSGQIKVESTGKKQNFSGQYSSNPASGDYLIVLPTGAEYELSYSITNYKSKTTIIDLADMVGFIEKTKNMSFDALFDSIKPGLKSVAMASALPLVKESPSEPLKGAIQTQTITGIKNEVDSKTETSTVSVKPADTQSVQPSTAQVTTKEISSPSTVISNTSQTSVFTSTTSPPAAEAITKQTKTLEPAPTVYVNLAQKKEEIENVKNDQKLVSSLPEKKDTIISTKPVETATPPIAEVKPASSNTNPVITKTIISTQTPTHVTTISDSTLSKLTATTATTATNTLTPAPAEVNSTATQRKINNFKNDDNFEPATAVQEKMMANAYKYGDITYDSLEFRVQVSAFKNNMHYYFPKLEKFGKIEKVELGDGYKRLMIGGSFKTYGRAFTYAKKVIKAGHDDVFIVVVYKGYRYSVEDLEDIGIFK